MKSVFVFQSSWVPDRRGRHCKDAVEAGTVAAAALRATRQHFTASLVGAETPHRRELHVGPSPVF